MTDIIFYDLLEYVISSPSRQSITPAAKRTTLALANDDSPRITMFLRDHLTNGQLKEVGLALGLNNVRLENINPDNLFNDVVHFWLKRADNVLDESGIPSLESLAKALEKVGMNGIAEDMRNGMLLDDPK